jgi:hypothetical protein
MSGPKAFRIVTRAEIMTICRRSLARLDAAIEDWISRGQRNGTVDKADIDRVIARRDALRALLSADKFVELQKQLPAEISYLQADAERRAEKAAELEAQSKRAMRRMQATAQALLASLESSGVQIPQEIREGLASSGTPSERLEAVINKAFLMLHSALATKGVSDLQRDIAAQLGAGEKRMSLEEWTSQRPGLTEDQALLRVDGFLGELKGLGIDPGPFSARISTLELESPARRTLLADSLLLDLATAVKNGREHRRLQSDLRARHAELSEMKSPEAASLRSEIGPKSFNGFDRQCGRAHPACGLSHRGRGSGDRCGRAPARRARRLSWSGLRSFGGNGDGLGQWRPSCSSEGGQSRIRR